jgi:hypothetical protein
MRSRSPRPKGASTNAFGTDGTALVRFGALFLSPAMAERAAAILASIPPPDPTPRAAAWLARWRSEW